MIAAKEETQIEDFETINFFRESIKALKIKRSQRKSKVVLVKLDSIQIDQFLKCDSIADVSKSLRNYAKL